MPRPKKIVLTEDEIAMYDDGEDCFGSHDPEVGYCEEADSCQSNNCEFTEKCKAICVPIFEALEEGKKPNIRIVDENGEVIDDFSEDEKSKDESSKEDKVEINRSYVLEQVVSVCKAQDKEPEVSSTTTRDKVFLGEDDVFIVTERALKINRLENGKKLGIDEKYWKSNNRGVQVDFDSDLDFVEITRKALQGLYVEDIARTYGDKKEEVKTDLFEGTEEPCTETVIDEGDKPIISSKVEVKDREEDFSPEEMDKGGVTKSLQIFKYSNGYNEVRIVSKANVSEILSSLKGFLE